jgi:hypothetical protein
MADPSDRERSAESRRILDQVERDTKRGGFMELALRSARGSRDHIAAADADQQDWAELWGTRIGRTIGAIAVLALLIWAVSLLAGGA